MRYLATLALLVGALFAAVPAWSVPAASRFKSEVAFGDSLVDAGNLFIATGGAFPDAAEGFFEGRNTNGYDYTDLLNIKLTGKPTVASLAGGDNYGFGGASVAGSFAAQIDQYREHLNAAGGAVDPGALFTVTFGDNDQGAIDNGDFGGLPDREAAIRAAAAAYAVGLRQLADLGARNLLVTGFLYLDRPTSHDLQGALQDELNRIALPAGTTLYQYSILDFFQRAASDPTSLGLPAGLDVSTPCRAAGASDCAPYLFYDGDHPTAAAHQAMLDDMNRQFGLFAAAVPEPGAWALMLCGFGFVGAQLRRARRARSRCAAR